MATISLSLPSDGQTIDAADVNTPFNTISAAINGNLDNDNIASGANISGTKLGALTTPLSKLDADGRGGWISGVLAAPNTITYNGNRSYDIVFNSTDYTDEVSNGMRLRLTRTVTPPTQCTDLESSSSQYWSKTSPAGTTFTDDFCAGAWIKLESYGTISPIVSRYNGTSGWSFRLSADGRVELIGYNAASANYSRVSSYQSIPLNKWVHVAAQLDMSTFTATSTTSYIMIDGISVPSSVDRGGTNPTALVQAGNLEVGSYNAGSQTCDGELAQVWYSSAKITQATIQGYISQGMSGSETSIVSLFKFNGDGNDSNANANNLTANAGATATTVDSPFNTTEYAVITKNAFSTNTTLTVQVPEGYAIPTSGGVSAVAYSTQDCPYGFPRDKGKWTVESLQKNQTASTSNATYGAFGSGGVKITVPVGSWEVGYNLGLFSASTTPVYFNLSATDITGSGATANTDFASVVVSAVNAVTSWSRVNLFNPQTLTSQTSYTIYTLGSTTSANMDGDNELCVLRAIPLFI